MRRGRSTGNPTLAEQARFKIIKRLGCLCCMARGYRHDPDGTVVEAHHLLSGGIRRGHRFTIGLCLWHHKGRLIVQGWSHAMHRKLLGPSLAEGSVPFHAEFGDDESLLAAQQRLINYHEEGISMRKQDYEQARDAGERARQAGRKRDTCPLYGMGSDGQAMREAWYSGWDEADEQRKAA